MQSQTLKVFRATGLAIALVACGAATGSATANDSVASNSVSSNTIYRVDLNKTQIVRLPAAASAVVIGNPAIADVTIHSPSTLFVVGRGFGETNLLILDRAGQTMLDANVQVTAVTPAHGVRVFNAKNRETYSCAPYCQPSPVLGDSTAFIGSNSVQTSSPSPVGAIFEGSSPQPGNGTPQGAPGSSDANTLGRTQF